MEEPQAIHAENVNGQPKSEALSPAFQTVVDLVAGRDADPTKKEWVRAHIRSIRETTRVGRHSILYYPASGTDIIRPLYAYNADHLIAIDMDKQRVGEAERQIRELGIQPEVETSDDGKRRVVTFEMDGRQRKITEVQDDVRLVSPKSFGLDQVDVLHIYAPTGATEAITEDEVYLKERYGDEWYFKRWQPEAREEMEKDPTAPKPDEEGKYKIVFEGMGSKLNVANYEMVSEGGYFVFGEGKLNAYDIPPSLLEMVGLEQQQIVTRYPYQVLTSMFPKPEEIATMDRTGYIYEKTRTVNSRAIEAFDDAVSTNFWTYYGFMEFERGNWWGLGINEGDNMDVKAAIENKHAGLQEEVTSLAQRFVEADVEPSLVERFKAETLDGYKTKVLALQQQLAELLKAYGDMSEKYNAGEMNDEQAIAYMGIVRERDENGNITETNNTKWPLASQLVLSNEGKSTQVYELASQFVDAEFFSK